MKKVIIATTINAPTEAIEKFDAMPDWELIVVGDQKTPDYKLKRGHYFSPKNQHALDPTLSELIGWNCIQRRNFGFIEAFKQGADLIATVDDDNIPLDDWGQSIHVGQSTQASVYTTDLPAFDPVGATNAYPVWHRGYPLPLLSKRDYSNCQPGSITADIQANFWHGDPDTDALCRMIYNPDIYTEDGVFPMASNQPAPFNSQNTVISRDWIKHYFMFPLVGRMDDIWAAYYIQALGANVIFDKATVVHARNVHDHTQDMQGELIGYEKNLALLEALKENPDNIKHFIPERSWEAFLQYQTHFS